jgi:kynureninase
MPRSAARHLQTYLDTWASRGVRAWHEGWWELGIETGNLLAPLLGVPPNTITMPQNVTVAHAIVASCHTFDGPRRRIVLNDLEFPSNMYVYEGFRRYGAEVVYVECADPVRAPLDRLLDAIDERTLLVPVSLVLFKSSYIQDAAAIVEKAHRVGARVVLDVYQATGTVPLDLERLGVDFAVGGSVKWLCGGAGAGYLYVRPDLARTLTPAFVGWAAHARPFNFERGAIRLADGPERFQSGTPNLPAMYAARAGYEIVREVGVKAIREKSTRLTRRIIELAEQRGFAVNTPRDDRERGGTVTIDMPGSERIAEELIRREIVIDYRPGAGIRMAPHFYNTEEEIERAMATLDDIAAEPGPARPERH